MKQRYSFIFKRKSMIYKNNWIGILQVKAVPIYLQTLKV